MLTATVTPGFEPSAGVPISVADLAAMARPNVTVIGSVGAGDLENGIVGWNTIKSDFLGVPGLSTALEDSDRILFHDTSAGVAAVMTVGVFAGQMIGVLPTYTAFESYTADKLPFFRSSSQNGGNMTPALIAEQLVEQAPTLSTIDEADLIGVVDVSATDGSRYAKITAGSLLPDKGTAGTYTGPTSINVDAKGRVTEILSTGTGQRTAPDVEAYQIALPTSAGYANATSLAHGLGTKPRFVDVQLICTDAGGDAGYAQNDVIQIGCVYFDTGTSAQPMFVVHREAADIKVSMPAGVGHVMHKTTGADTTITTTKWKWMASALK